MPALALLRPSVAVIIMVLTAPTLKEPWQVAAGEKRTQPVWTPSEIR